jgi:hypothetical protein
VIAIGTVILIVALMFIGPSLGLAPNVDVQVETFTAPRADATAANVQLDLSVAETRDYRAE